METETLTVAVWEDDVDKFIYMFDPNPRSNTGMPQPLNGTACVLCFTSFKGAADHFISLIPDEEKRQGEFTITPIEIIVAKRKKKKKRRRPRRRPQNICTAELLEKKRKVIDAVRMFFFSSTLQYLNCRRRKREDEGRPKDVPKWAAWSSLKCQRETSLSSGEREVKDANVTASTREICKTYQTALLLS